MDRMNITEYQIEPGEYRMFYGKASLKSEYYIANYDERFFHMIGTRVYLSVPELLHPDDVDTFMEAVSMLDEGPQHIIIRIICHNEKYRSFYAVLKYNERILDGFHSFDMELSEIMSITDRYKDYCVLVDKYREYMTLYTGLFMEYEYKTGNLKLYEYINRQSHSLCSEKLETLYADVINDDSLTVEQKSEFQILYDTLKKGRDHSKVVLDSIALVKQAENVRYEIRLSTIYYEELPERVIGLVNIVNGEQPKKNYYLTENAFDPGTGLLNKRAINEYAIEKIQKKTEGLYLAIMDVDDFKRINDNFGHMFGDEVLSRVAEIVKSIVKSRGVVGRFGGDEFMIVLEGIESEPALRRILSTIGRNIEWAFNNVEGLKVTASIGVSKYPEDGTTYEELFQTADKCVYIGKEKGKNRYIIYDVKKHGVVEKEDSSRINIGLKAAISNSKKNEIVSELILQLYRRGSDVLIPVMEQMQSYFDIDGIALYGGDKMERVCSVGKYINPIQSFMCVHDESYKEFFDEQGCYEIERVNVLENKAPEAYELYTKQENGKVIQCVAMQDGMPVSLVSFDFFNRHPKLGTADSGLMRIMGRMLAEVVARER